MKYIINALLLILSSKAIGQDNVSLIPFRLGDLWGYSDTNAQIVITPIYDEALPFKNDSGFVQKNSKLVIIDTKGNEIVTPPIYFRDIFPNIDSFKTFKNEHLTIWKYKKNQSVIRRGKGDQITVFIDQSNCNNEEIGENYSLIKNDGKFILPGKYTSIRALDDSCIIVCQTNCAIYNEKGQQVLDFKYCFKETPPGPLIKIIFDQKYGYINKKGSVVIPPIYDELGNFQNGYVTGQIGMKYCVLDSTGTVILENMSGSYHPVMHGYTVAKKADSSYLLDIKSRREIPIAYQSILLMENGDIFGRKGNKWYLLDKNILPLHQLGYDQVTFYEEEILINKNKPLKRKDNKKFYVVKNNGKYGVIDNLGQLVLKDTFPNKIWIHDHCILTVREFNFTIVDFNGNHKSGYVYKSLREINEARNDQRSLYYFTQNGKKGIVDSDNNIIQPPIYDQIFPDGQFLKVYINRKVGLLNLDGKTLIEPAYNDIIQSKIILYNPTFSKKYFLVQDGSLTYYVDQFNRKFYRSN